MSQQLDQVDELHPTGQPTPVSSTPARMDTSTSMASHTDEALRPANISGASISTEQNRDNDTGPTFDVLGVGVDHKEETTVDTGIGKQTKDDIKDDIKDDTKDVNEDSDDDFEENVSLDWHSSYFKLNWGEVRDRTYEERKKKAKSFLKHTLCHEILVFERIDAIERILTKKGFMQAETSADEKSKDQTLLQSGTLIPTKLGWFDFTSCEVDKLEPTCFAILLMEKPIRSIAERVRHVRAERSKTNATKNFGSNSRIERIQFPTLGAKYLFDEIMWSRVPGRGESILRPFKPLFAYYRELQTRYGDAKRTTVVDEGEVEDKVPEPSPALKAPTGDSATTPAQDDSLDDETTREHNKVVTAQAILDLTRSDLKDDLKVHLECRQRKTSLLQFDDTWHLFFPGDVVYDPKLDQALQVLCVQNGRAILDSDQGDGSPQLQGSKTPLAVLTFSVDFDGQTFGPAQHSYTIEAWEGEQTITSLPIYPVEYATTEHQAPATVRSTKKEALQERGHKFCEIVNTPQAAHRQYRGFDIGKVREQIDSDVIVDVGFFYEQNPSEAPKIGLTHPPPGDRREVFDTTHTPDPDKGSIVIFDDRTLEADRMNVFISENKSDLLQRTRVGETLTEARQLLLPRGVWAYVFRNREWFQLDVNNIQPLEQNHQSFDDLVLHSDHKRLVQSLVKTHSTGIKPTTESVGRSESDLREDLVRGKGKGVIILLHGVPGVGKSSTAECVAEYTKRPLLAITCGDIGQTAEEVQHSLEHNLNLAHRWGCVMLLDEADVFLTARDKRDLQRNAIVSVFLRVLEYYSGILFLTTNKVGAFDEAFKSRIHLSLYYDKLTADQTWKIWDVNLKKQMTLRPHLLIDKEELLRWGERNYLQCQRDGKQIWNGRQIRNACQTAAALAEADEKGTMQVSHLDAVAKASLEFDKYLKIVYGGDDAERARRAGERADAYASINKPSYTDYDDDRYSDYYRDRDYGYEPPRRRSRGPRVPRDDRLRDRFEGRGSGRDDDRYAERRRSPAVEPRDRPRGI